MVYGNVKHCAPTLSCQLWAHVQHQAAGEEENACRGQRFWAISPWSEPIRRGITGVLNPLVRPGMPGVTGE